MLSLLRRRLVSAHTARSLQASAARGGLRWQHAQAAEEVGREASEVRRFAVPPLGPLALYLEGVRSGKFSPDPQQRVTVQKLQRVWQEVDTAAPRAASSGLTLVDAVDEGPTWKLWNFLAHSLDDAPDPVAVKGLYLFGGVGSGKTMLMDIFYDSLQNGVRKKRVHFHDFMLDVHRRLRDMKHVADPLRAVAEDFMRAKNPDGGRTVLCLDEFMVTDVADALILKRLFTHLFGFGLVLISTSNRPPEKLYEGGLQRSLFLPFIALLQERCEVHDIRGAQDYRLLARKLAQPLYFTGPAASLELSQLLPVFAPGASAAPQVIDVAMGRSMRVPRAAGPVACFPFPDLCEQPVAAADYIALCERFHTILVDGAPVFDAASRAAAHRLVTLVDVAYEQRVRLIFAAAAPPPQLFAGIVTQADFRAIKAGATGGAADELVVDDVVGFSKERTVSRLIEMSSLHYARQHAARHAPELLPSLPEEAVV